jgi:hypothetical protein
MDNLTIEQRIKRHIILKAKEAWAKTEYHYDDIAKADRLTDENIDEVWDSFEEYELQDAMNEFRCGGEPSGTRGEYSRHYESEQRAAKLSDGTWVSWTYWYGGGKHGEPDAVEWIPYAYEVACKEEEKLVVVRTFSEAVAHG